MKWYEKNIVIVLLLIFFFPVGLFLMWKCARWKSAVKIVISGLIAVGCIGVILNPSPITQIVNNSAVSSSDNEKDKLSSDNILLNCKVKKEDMKNAFGEVIGKYAYINILKSELKDITEDNLKEFAETVIASDEYKTYNYFAVKCDDETGLLFSGGSAVSIIYGKFNDDNMIEDTIGFIMLDNDGHYSYTAD